MKQLLFVAILGLTACGSGGEVRSLRAVDSSPLLGGEAGVDVTLVDNHGFELAEGQGIMVIGSAEFCIRRYAESDVKTAVIFTLRRPEFDDLRDRDPVWLQQGRGFGWPKRSFGNLDKSKLAN